MIGSGGNLADVDKLRAHYVAALRAADNDDIIPLLKFARNRVQKFPVSAQFTGLKAMERVARLSRSER